MLMLLPQAPAMQAQGVTYNHDASKMNQVQVMELGAGVLTPDLYYRTLHSNYKSSAGELNKSILRLNAMLQAHKQIEMADSVQSDLKKRAEIEALNVADREVDVAWYTEATKLDGHLQQLRKAVNRLATMAGAQEREMWQELVETYTYAITTIHTAYQPNSLRQKQYVTIAQEIISTTNAANQRIQYLHVQARYKQLAQMMNLSRPEAQEAIRGAHSRWMQNASRATGKTVTP